MRKWRICAASAIGKGHIDNDTPCQDAFDHAYANGRLVVVVCDGAGSAARSEIGAKECASSISTFLTAFEGVPAAASEQSVIVQAVELARTRIEAHALELALAPRELGCTMIGAVLHESGGCLFHIGDGVGVAELEDGAPVVSLPENGEYANETYFVTNADWRDHLRVNVFAGAVRCLALMSDGAMPFAFKRTALFGPFIDPVKSFLTNVGEPEGSQALQATLASEGTWKITGDDKTLLLVLPS